MTENNAAQPGLTDAIAVLKGLRNYLCAHRVNGPSMLCTDGKALNNADDEVLRALKILVPLSKLRAEGVQAGDETQALIEHDRWFSEYGQRLGSFYNSLTIHTRAAWVAASKRYAALASAPASEDGLTAKQAWWAGYRAGKGLPPDTPRQDAVKVDISSARLVTHWPNGTPRDERDTASDPEGKLIHDPTEPLLAASAPIAGEAQKPTLYQARIRPTWRTDENSWSKWEDCTAEQAADYERVPLLHDWQYEVRRLYAAPQASEADDLIGALGQCRDAFPIPATAGSPLDLLWQEAMSDPAAVPAYVKACASNGQAREAVRDPVAQMYEDLLMYGIAIQRVAPAEFLTTQADKDGGICATCRGTGEVANLPSWPSLQVCGNGPVWKKCPDCGDCAKGGHEAGTNQPESRTNASFGGGHGDCAKGAGDVRAWQRLTDSERDGFVGELVDYGTDFVSPLYAVVESIERRLREKNAALAAQKHPRTDGGGRGS